MSLPTASQWRNFLLGTPGALGGLLGDLFAAADGSEAREHGVDDVYALLWPEGSSGEVEAVPDPDDGWVFSVEPLSVAIRPFLRPSARGFAAKVGMPFGQVWKLLHGERPLSKDVLERFAVAAKVNPAFFREYREMVIVDAVSKALKDNPSLTADLYRKVPRSKPRR